MASRLFDIAARDTCCALRGGGGLDAARYLVDLHDAEATCNFCGGMLFQLVLTDALGTHPMAVAKHQQETPVTAPATVPAVEVFNKMHKRMAAVEGYARRADADNLRFFHGPRVDTAGGGGVGRLGT